MFYTTRPLNFNWKGPSTKSAIGASNRPNTNLGHISNSEEQGTYNTNAQDYIGQNSANGSYIGAKPIKHWRKQLLPTAHSGHSKATVNQMEIPGGTVMVDNSCCDPNVSGGEIIYKK